MDALKIIPQVFFDLIGRIVPGILALLLGNLLLPEAWKLQFIAALSAFSGKQEDSVSMTLLFFVAYIIGHLISPLTKRIQRFNEWNQWRIPEPKPNSVRAETPEQKEEEKETKSIAKALVRRIKNVLGWCKKAGNSVLSVRLIRIFQYLVDQEKRKKKHEEEGFSNKKYEWLRANHPDSGGHCAKLRAEFTMYNSFAALFLIGFFSQIVMLCWCWQGEDGCACTHLITGLVLLFLFMAMSARGEETECTFQKTVVMLHKSHQGPIM